MFAALLPAFVLPPLSVAAAWFGQSLRGVGTADLTALVLGVFMFVQLGSQVLNGWLILRRPASFETRALPRSLGVVNATIYGVLVVWSAVMIAFPDSTVVYLFAGSLALLGLVALFITLDPRVTEQRTYAHSVPRFSPLTRTATITYLVVSASGLIAAASIAGVTGNSGYYQPILAGVPALILIVLGLPWSHPLYGTVFAVSLFTGGEGQHSWIVLVVLALPVVANMAIAGILVGSPARQISLLTWFFRLNQPTTPPEAP
jgi:hypothetical protein